MNTLTKITKEVAINQNGIVRQTKNTVIISSYLMKVEIPKTQTDYIGYIEPQSIVDYQILEPAKDNIEDIEKQYNTDNMKHYVNVNVNEVMIANKFVSKDELQTQLTMIYIDSNGLIVATDAHALYQNTKGEKIDNYILINPFVAKLINLLKTNNEIIKIELNKENAKISMTKGSVVFTLPSFPYPNFSMVIPKNTQYSANLGNRKKLIKILKSIKTKYILMSNSKLYFYNNIEDTILDYKFTSQLPFVYPISFTRLLLIRCLENIKNETVTMELNDPNSIVMLENVLLMPITYDKAITEKETHNKGQINNDKLTKVETKSKKKEKTIAKTDTAICKVVKMPVVQEQEPTQEPEQNPEYIVVNYSAKAFAIFGQTKEIKDQLKALHMRFNPFLKLNDEKTPGWIGSLKRKDEILSKLNISY